MCYFYIKYIYNEEILTILADLLAEDDAVVDYTIHMDDYSINLEFGVGKIDNDTVLSTIQEFFNTEEVQEKIEDALIDLEKRNGVFFRLYRKLFEKPMKKFVPVYGIQLLLSMIFLIILQV